MNAPQSGKAFQIAIVCLRTGDDHRHAFAQRHAVGWNQGRKKIRHMFIQGGEVFSQTVGPVQ